MLARKFTEKGTVPCLRNLDHRRQREAGDLLAGALGEGVGLEEHVVSAGGQRRFQRDGFQRFARGQAPGAIDGFAGLRERDFEFRIRFRPA